MKFRTEFVTNSSSSSFIIALKEDIPEKFKKYLEPITKENVLDKILEFSGFYKGYKIPITSGLGLSFEKEKELLGVDDKVYAILHLAMTDSDKMENYIEILKYFKEHNKPLYYYNADWDWEFHYNDLRQFIRRQVFIDFDN